MIDNAREIYGYDIRADEFVGRVDVMCLCPNCGNKVQLSTSFRKNWQGDVDLDWLKTSLEFAHNILQHDIESKKLVVDTKIEWEYSGSKKISDLITNNGKWR